MISLLYEDADHDIVMIEMRGKTGVMLADQYDVEVVHGDGSDLRVLEMARVENADMLIALTGEDETNLVISQIAKMHFHVKTTVARVNNAKNMPVFKKLGVDRIYSGTKILADIIDHEIHYSGMRLAFDIPDSEMGILEFFLDPNCEAIGKTLQDYTFPGQSKVVLLTRTDGQVYMPTGDLQLLENDRMLLVAKHKHFDKIWHKVVNKEGKF